MEEKKPTNKEVFRRKRNKYYLREEEGEWNKKLIFYKIVATESKMTAYYSLGAKCFRFSIINVEAYYCLCC